MKGTPAGRHGSPILRMQRMIRRFTLMLGTLTTISSCSGSIIQRPVSSGCRTAHQISPHRYGGVPTGNRIYRVYGNRSQLRIWNRSMAPLMPISSSNLGSGLPDGIPYTQWAADLVKESAKRESSPGRRGLTLLAHRPRHSYTQRLCFGKSYRLQGCW